MGMFDWVDYDGKCWKCGATLTRWQTKHAGCQLNEIRPEDIDGGEMHTLCECGAWNSLTVKVDGPIPERPRVPFHVERNTEVEH